MNAVLRILRLGRSGRSRLLASVALGVLAAGAAVGLAGTSAWLIVRAAEHPPVLYLMVAIVAVRAFGVGRGVLRYSERLVSHDASFRVLGDLRVAVVRRVERLLPGGTRSLSRGDLLTRFVGDVDGLADLWVRVLLPAAVTLLVGMAAVTLMIVLLPVAGLVLAGVLLCTLVVAPAVATTVTRRSAARVAPLKGEYQQQLLGVLDGAAELTVYGAVGPALAQLDRLDEQLRAGEARAAWGAGIGTALGLVAAGAGVTATLWLGAGALGHGSLSSTSFAVAVLLPLAVHELVALLAPAAAQVPELVNAAGRLVQVLDSPDPVRDPEHAAAVPTGPFGLHLRDVSLAWPHGPTVVSHVDAHIPALATVAIVGPSGAGKSTLAAALLRFIEPEAGTIELIGADGTVDLTDLAGDDVRRVIGWCAQDSHIFDSTVAANLRLARPGATDDALRAALLTAGLGPWLAGLPDGLDTSVGEHGRSLSGGERQRLAVARVVLSQAAVVILDEPTEHLDDATGRALVVDLLASLPGRTVLIATHRLDLMPPLDAVLTLGD